MSGNARYNGMDSFAEWQQDWKNEDRYNFRAIEAKWQKIWEAEKAYKVEIDKSKPQTVYPYKYPEPFALRVNDIKGAQAGSKNRINQFSPYKSSLFYSSQ